MVPTSFDRQVAYLLAVDPFFAAFWDEVGAEGRRSRQQLAEDIEFALRRRQTRLAAARQWSHEITRRFFLPVQEVGFRYSAVPKDWHAFVRDERAKADLYQAALRSLRAFVYDQWELKQVRLYGGIKPGASIERKVGALHEGGMRNLQDLWDVVRFRIVTPDLISARSVALRLWYSFMDSVVRCRNYYYRPKNENVGDPYRAIHFEVAMQRQRLVEVQVMTEARELVCFLDYAPQFKKAVPFANWRQRRWLSHFSQKTNIYDCSRLFPTG